MIVAAQRILDACGGNHSIQRGRSQLRAKISWRKRLRAARGRVLSAQIRSRRAVGQRGAYMSEEKERGAYSRPEGQAHRVFLSIVSNI
jgi:hypothetical protein